MTMQISSNITLAERIESLKAGILAALSAGSLFLVLIASHLWLAQQSEHVLSWQVAPTGGNWWVSWAIATLSGFLFGVTYRYVIRHDQNPHLKSGAVLAFGLVRGLAQLDAEFTAQTAIVPAVILLVESVLLFAVARLVLDWALSQKWVKPFQSN